MISDEIKQAMKQARQKRRQEDKARVAAQQAWRAPAKEAAAAERREIVDVAINERRAFELKYADVGIVKHVSPAKIKKQIMPSVTRKASKYGADRRWRVKNEDYVNGRQRRNYARRKAKQAAVNAEKDTGKQQ